MTKKKKSSAQDLIDSLLDDPRDVRPHSAKPSPPPLPDFTLSPPGAARKAKDVSPETLVNKSVRFEFDVGKADGSLKLVGDKTHVQSQAAKPVLQAKRQSEESALSPSEVRNAPTLVVSSSKGKDLESDGLVPLNLSAASSDKTMAIPETKRPSSLGAIDRKQETEVRFGIGAMGGNKSSALPKASSPPSGAVFTSAEASLKQSESLRIAQMRIHELEQELDRIRRENERLASAGETLRRRTDELLARTESLESQTRDSQKTHDEEKKVLRGQLSAKDRESIELRAKLEETETRLEGNFKRIRVRERELEHRLEIVKMENATLVSTKDEMIMRLKREIDQLKFETENGKVRSQELYSQYKDKQETIGRVVRALRIALTILEGDEDSQKKNEG